MRNAVILFNLGGPQSLKDVRPFLYNLFNDPAIFSLPQPFRSFLAWLVARHRTPKASEIYRYLGGGSPILANTLDQADHLQKALGSSYRVFTVMRYWQPRAQDVIEAVKEFAPDRCYLLPLYPQFSTSTTASSVHEFKSYAQYKLPKVPLHTFCCYPTQPNWIAAYVDLIRKTVESEGRPFRLLFSAHGLPERTIKNGDPYQYQINLTVNEIMKSFPGQDFRICYQSRVGPMKWIGPTTESQIIQAGQDNVGVVLIPVSFVSEHSETLYELDHLFGELAIRENLPFYYRVPTVSTHPLFIQALVDLIQNAVVRCTHCKNKVLEDEEMQISELISPQVCPPHCVKGLCINQ